MDCLKRLIAAILLACTGLAQAEFSATTLLASDYVFRGISNTDEDPTIQGSLDYEHENGFYAGVWASNVKFRENAGVPAAATVEEASIEIDYYAGFASEFESGIYWDAGALYYSYPGAEDSLDYDYWEAMATLGYAFEEAALGPEIGVELYHSPEFFGKSGDASYAAGMLDLSLPGDFGLGFSAGKQWFHDDSSLDYTDWKVAITKSLEGFDFEVAYTDTDLSKADCGGLDICEGRAVVSIARTTD
ncbi:MAG: TorF family putative porin [Gammaproteobacteria bacterium]|nr:TorF family putative porin [Gammaproteobacteria bacterium]NNJ94203.1 hypothetical protein [Halobacteria archaeon]